MEKELRINNLVFEITRKCNMECEHCLRGDQENVDVMENVMINTLSEVCSVNCVIFSGGDPSLNVPAITEFRNLYNNLGFSLLNFWVATNGKKDPTELCMELLKLRIDILEDDSFDDYSGITLSKDQFHEDVNERHINILKSFSFYTEDKERELDDTQIINLGKAYDNGLGRRDIDFEEIYNSTSIQEEEENSLIVEEVYINVYGDVLLNCDFSFELQEEFKIGNVLETPLTEILMNFKTNREESLKEETAI